MGLKFLILTMLLASACVKEAGDVKKAGSTDGETGSSTGGTSGGTSSGGTSGGGSTNGSVSNGTDPLAAFAWHLKNTGTQSAFANGTGKNGEDINVEYVHSTLNIRGRNVRIAVSDTGTQIDHPDLANNSLPDSEHRNYVFSNPAKWKGASPLPGDDDAHGTAVTGLIAAVGWNNIGSRGVAPSAKFGAFRFLGDLLDSETEESYLAKELDQMYGDFDVFNYSYGSEERMFQDYEDSVEEALKVGTTSLRNGRGAIYVQSSGNGFEKSYKVGSTTYITAGNTNSDPALSGPYKIVVGATNALGEKASYSRPGSSIWVSAPGGEDGMDEPAMLTTDIAGCNGGYSFGFSGYFGLFNYGKHPMNMACDYTNVMNGTSSAAPVTSGVVALMLEARPQLTWRDIKHILAVTSDEIEMDPFVAYDRDFFTNVLSHPHGEDLDGHVYDYKWIVNKAGYEFSNWYGFGRVNARKAVEMALSYNLGSLGLFEQTKNASGNWYYQSGTLSGFSIISEAPIPTDSRIWVGHNFEIEHVQVEVKINHPFPGDLAIMLESPGQTESRLLTVNNKIYSEGGIQTLVMGTNAFYGEMSHGYWTIKIVDGSSVKGNGELLSWKILVSGHRKSTDLSKPQPVTFPYFSSIPLANDRTPNFSFTTSVSHSALVRYEAMVERDFDGTPVTSWISLGLMNMNHYLNGFTLNSGEIYNLKIRAVGPGNQYSPIQLLQWRAP